MKLFIIPSIAWVIGAVKRNSRLAAVALFVVLWALMGLNTYNDDWVGNEYLYSVNHQVAGAGQTIGYLLLTNAARLAGLNFSAFRIVASAVALLLLTLFVCRYTRSVALVLALYLVLPFLYDVVQFRFFIASSIAIYGLHFLIEKRGKVRALYLVFVAVASLIHPACIIYTLFLIGCLSERNAIWAGIVLALLVLLGIYGEGILLIADVFVDSVKYEAYFAARAHFGFLPYWVSILTSVIMVAGTRPNRFTKTSHSPGICPDKLSPIERRSLMFDEFIRKAIFAFLPFGALMPLSVQNFYRILRSSLILVYIFYANSSSELVLGQIAKQDKKILSFFFWVWHPVTTYIVLHGVWDIVVLDELSNNLIWTWFR